VARELLVAVSGVLLVLFILGHLAGNFILFRGPEAYNAYSRHLHDLGALLWVVRAGLLAAFVAHVTFTIQLALANRAARKTGYTVVTRLGNTDFVKLTMLYSGLLVLTLANTAGPRADVIAAHGSQNLGIYGVVWNSFSNPIHAVLYILAMAAVGLHFSNAVSTIWVTLGVLSDAATARVNLAARVLGALIAVGFSSIPVYVLFATHLTGV
jgi:succinate dehydrogenase / fumarate reductase cytochrome b subunit